MRIARALGMLPAMSSLRDQLLKAGLVSQKQARQSQHQRRVKRKTEGREGVEAERAAKRAELAAQKAAERAAAKARSAARNAETDARSLQNQINQIVKGGKARIDERGRRRFYFETRDERVVYLALGDADNEQLQSGQLAIVESASGKVSVVDRATVARVAELDARWVRRWNGRPAAG